MLFVNDQPIGLLKLKGEATGQKVSKPEMPGQELNPAYFTGLQQNHVELGFTTQTYSESLRILEEQLQAGIPVILQDDIVSIVNAQNAATVLIEEYELKSQDLSEFGVGTIKAVVLTHVTIDALYPADDLYPDDDLFPSG